MYSGYFFVAEILHLLKIKSQYFDCVGLVAPPLQSIQLMHKIIKRILATHNIIYMYLTNELFATSSHDTKNGKNKACFYCLMLLALCGAILQQFNSEFVSNVG